MTNPAAETKLIGVPTHPSSSWRIMVFAPASYWEPLRQFYSTNKLFKLLITVLVISQKLTTIKKDLSKKYYYKIKNEQ